MHFIQKNEREFNGMIVLGGQDLAFDDRSLGVGCSPCKGGQEGHPHTDAPGFGQGVHGATVTRMALASDNGGVVRSACPS